MAGKRSMFFFGLMLFLLSTPGYGATLQYASGAFAATPYIYGKITDTACGPPDPPVMEEYNPGPLYISGSKNMNISYCSGEVNGQVSWNIGATYGKTFSLNGEGTNWINRVDCTADNHSFIRLSTNGLTLQVMPEAGESIGQTVRLSMNYIVQTANVAGNNTDHDPAQMILESEASQPNKISVNGISRYSFPLFQVSSVCSSCIPWSDYKGVEYSFANYNGPWPYVYEIEPETYIVA